MKRFNCIVLLFAFTMHLTLPAYAAKDLDAVKAIARAEAFKVEYSPVRNFQPASYQSKHQSVFDEVYKIHSYDELTVLITDKEGKQTKYDKLPVLPNGRIVLPELGEVIAENISAVDLESQLNRRSLDGKRYNILVYHPKGKVSVIGQVKKPGAYPLSSGMTVYDAIGAAGGFSFTANKHKVKVIRQHRDGTRDSYFIDFPREIYNAETEGSGIGVEKYQIREKDIVSVRASKLRYSLKVLMFITQVATIGLVSGFVANSFDD